MRFNIDGYYEIGASHSICEDYILISKPNENFCFGIICDGCTGSPSTEMGARIIAHHAKKAIDELYKFDPFFATQNIQPLVMPIAKKIISGEAENSARFLGLPIECLDVTTWILLTSKKGEDITFSVMGWGDGQIIVRKKNSFCIYVVNYPSQAPFYLNYYFNDVRMETYKKNFSPDLEFSLIVSTAGTVDDPGNKRMISKEIRPCNTPTVLHLLNNPQDPIISVSICSDGFKTFNSGLNPETEEYGSLIWASERIIDYQSFEGVFVERRMKALARRDAKENIKHHDDIGMVSVLLLEEEENGQGHN